LNQITSTYLAEDNCLKEEEKKKEQKKSITAFSYTFVHSLSTDLAIAIAIVIIIMMITGATEKKEKSCFRCVHEEVEKKKAPKWVTTQQKKGVKNCTPNKIIQKKRESKNKFVMNESDRQAIAILLSFILNIH